MAADCALSPRPPIDAATRLLGVIGHPVGHSLSPALHNYALTLLAREHPPAAVNYRYLAFDVTPADLPQAMAGFRALGLAGINATIPHKESLPDLLDGLSTTAAAIGAVNTVVRETDGRLIGHNTDAWGFTTALCEALGRSPAGAHVVMIGAGGAARAVLYALLAAGVAQVTVVNRTLSRARNLIQSLSCHGPSVHLQAAPLHPDSWPLDRTDILINTTSLGLKPETGDTLDFNAVVAALPDHALAHDIVYARGATPLVRAARQRGLAHADGLSMLVHQGAQALQLWTGLSLPAQDVIAHLRSLTGEMS
ncbi:MAG: shikimate dehydrogenase [Magnetococcus sp. WYHC-3]